MDLARYVRVLRRHVLGVIACVVCGGLLAFGWTLFQPREYTADATGTVTARNSTDNAAQSSILANLARDQVAVYEELAHSRSVAKYAIDKLGLSTSPEELVGHITVDNPQNTPVLKVYATAESPQAARNLATEWLRGLAEQGTAKDGGANDGVLRMVITESAVLPSAPSSPNVKLDVFIGLAVGAVVAVLYAFVRSLVDKRIRTVQALEEQFGIPVVGTIPKARSLNEDNRLLPRDGAAEATDDVAMSEALRELRTNIQFMNVDDPPRILVVTSPLPSDGKSTLTANLAQVIAASGQSVVIVEGDLRRPTLAQTFNVIPTAGLTDVLIGRADLEDVMQPAAGIDGLWVVGCGQTPPNPSELLGSDTMITLLRKLSQDHLVLVDAPPLLPVTDAAILTGRTDGAIVVVRAGRTKTDDVDRALQRVELVKGKVFGMILNQMPRRGPDSHSYGYSYSSYYRPSGVTGAEGSDQHDEESVSTPAHAL